MNNKNGFCGLFVRKMDTGEEASNKGALLFCGTLQYLVIMTIKNDDLPNSFWKYGPYGHYTGSSTILLITGRDFVIPLKKILPL